MSFLIEHIGKICNESSRDTIYVYYYCYFAHHQDETKPFLKWLIARLCWEAGGVPTVVYDLNRHGTETSITALLDAITQLLISFDTVYILVDAVDESTSRDDLLQTLRTFATDRRFEKIQLVTSSRNYIDIETIMSIFSVPVSMDNPLVEQDIRHYVHSSVESNSKFRRWPYDLFRETEESITNGARGM